MSGLLRSVAISLRARRPLPLGLVASWERHGTEAWVRNDVLDLATDVIACLGPQSLIWAADEALLDHWRTPSTRSCPHAGGSILGSESCCVDALLAVCPAPTPEQLAAYGRTVRR